MVHVFSLIHDDLPAIDNDQLRRGLPTCHVKFGEATAILAGDALLALAFEVMSAPPSPSGRGGWGEREPAVAALMCVRSLASALGSDGLVAGEIVDVLSEGKTVDHSTLEYIHSRKTGALIAASCEIGAILGGADEASVAGMRKFGAWVGLAFQVADDILNETSSVEALGKAAGTDRSRGKATYPALHGLDGARHAAAAFVEIAVDSLPSKLADRELLLHLAQYAVERTS
jgi:geranylgeranyl diphosphate synthase type II